MNKEKNYLQLLRAKKISRRETEQSISWMLRRHESKHQTIVYLQEDE